MFAFIVKRILQGIPVLFCVATLTFFMIRLAPGGPFSAERAISPEILQNINKHYGLDQSAYKQYLNYMCNVARGDLGPSYKYSNRSVNEIIEEAFPVSLQLGFLAIVVALLLGIALGVLAAIRPNSMLDYFTMSFAMSGICVPVFVLGPILIWVFGIKLGWFNVTGWNTWGDYVLPTITLGSFYAANIARLSRASMMEILSQDFIRTARAKGLREHWVIVKHCLRGGLLPVVSYIGPTMAGIITGSFVVETIFHIPGLGKIFVQSAFDRDYTVITGTVLFYAFIIVLLNMICDILLILMDPRRTFNE